jgi:hypothetical protein
MNDISRKSPEYQALETLLIQKNPSIRFQQVKERENKELLDPQLIQSSLTEKTRTGSSMKTLIS